MRVLRKFWILPMLFLVTACVEAVVAGGAAATYVLINSPSDKSVAEEAATDKSIGKNIKHLLKNDENKAYFRNINVHVLNGDAILTGIVAHEKYADDAIRAAKNNRDVTTVTNEIQVSGSRNFANDLRIKGNIRSKYMANKRIKSSNYDVEVVNGMVFLFGRAASQEEYETAAGAASTVRGVKKVHSYVVMK